MSPPLSPAPPPKPSAGAGFTLLEMLMVLALMGVLVLLGIPSMLNAINRAKLAGFAQQVATAMQGARLEAIKRSRVARVEVHFTDNSVIAYVPADKDVVFVPGTDFLVFQAKAPAGVVLGGPGAIPADALKTAYTGFAAITDGAVALFNSDGSVSQVGGFRIRDLRGDKLGDKLGNVMEAFVSPQASARIAVRKFAGDSNGPDDSTQYFEADESPGWKWN